MLQFSPFLSERFHFVIQVRSPHPGFDILAPKPIWSELGFKDCIFFISLSRYLVLLRGSFQAFFYGVVFFFFLFCDLYFLNWVLRNCVLKGSVCYFWIFRNWVHDCFGGEFLVFWGFEFSEDGFAIHGFSEIGWMFVLVMSFSGSIIWFFMFLNLRLCMWFVVC